MILVTNNPMAKEYFENVEKAELKFDYQGFEVKYIEAFGYMDVLVTVRDMVQKGYELVTHPLSGSIKPNETPYKSVAVRKAKAFDMNSNDIIENAIATFQKFEKDKGVPQWIDRVKEDFMVVDFDLIKNALRR